MYDSGRLRQRQVFIGERELGIEQSRFVPFPEAAWHEPQSLAALFKAWRCFQAARQRAGRLSVTIPAAGLLLSRRSLLWPRYQPVP